MYAKCYKFRCYAMKDALKIVMVRILVKVEVSTFRYDLGLNKFRKNQPYLLIIFVTLHDILEYHSQGNKKCRKTYNLIRQTEKEDTHCPLHRRLKRSFMKLAISVFHMLILSKETTVIVQVITIVIHAN